jgi:hypothetical protein
MNNQKVKIKKTTIFKFKQFKIKDTLDKSPSSVDAITYHSKHENT